MIHIVKKYVPKSMYKCRKINKIQIILSNTNNMEKTEKLEEYLDDHYINRSNWLRAAVLGANDGILSTASLAI